MATGSKSKETDTKTLAVTGEAHDLPEYVPGTSWDESVAVADTVAGHDLAKDDLLDALVGVPFLITRLTFRDGIPNNKVDYEPAVCAVETVIASADALRQRRVDMTNLPFLPDSQVVFNDGSTGIYRQLVHYLTQRGYIEVPEDLPESGGMGETRYDLPPELWSAIHAGTLDTDRDGRPVYTINVRLTAPRGLRLSTYPSDYNPNGGKTRYLG